MDDPTPYSLEHNLKEQCDGAKAIIAESRPGDVLTIRLEPWEIRSVVQQCLRTACRERGWDIQWLTHRDPKEIVCEILGPALPPRRFG